MAKKSPVWSLTTLWQVSSVGDVISGQFNKVFIWLYGGFQRYWCFSWFKARRLDLYINAQHPVIEFWLSPVILWEWQPWFSSADLDVSKNSLSESFHPQLSHGGFGGMTLTGAHLSSKKFVLFLSLERKIGPGWASLREVNWLLLFLIRSYLGGGRKEEECTELNNWAGSE